MTQPKKPILENFLVMGLYRGRRIPEKNGTVHTGRFVMTSCALLRQKILAGISQNIKDIWFGIKEQKQQNSYGLHHLTVLSLSMVSHYFNSNKNIVAFSRFSRTKGQSMAN